MHEGISGGCSVEGRGEEETRRRRVAAIRIKVGGDGGAIII